MAIRPTYEGSSEGAVRHWEIPFTRLNNAVAPTPTQPAYVTVPAAERALRHGATGTILSTDTTHVPSVAVIDFTRGAVYKHNVRNVLTYGGQAEASWGALNVGDPVYYDDSATMPADYFLSKSPSNGAGLVNPLFGFIVAIDDVDAALYPKAGAVAASLTNVAVIQRGA
jgi:hypothetical protein